MFIHLAEGARVLNKLTGHTDSATRERIYQDPQNERVRARVAEARRSMRASARLSLRGGTRREEGRINLSYTYPTPAGFRNRPSGVSCSK